jgi:hypothetical protein
MQETTSRRALWDWDDEELTKAKLMQMTAVSMLAALGLIALGLCFLV